MDSKNLTTAEASTRARGNRIVLTATTAVGTVALGAAGALVLGLGSTSSAGTSPTSSVDQSVRDRGDDQGQAGFGVGPSQDRGPVASSGGS